MSKSIVYDSEAKEKILSGIDKLEKAVSVTLGPCGKNVIIDEFGQVHSTRDGVTVAKAVSFSDKFENIGAQAVKEVAEKSADRVGDGTTTSTVLAASIYRNGLKYVSLGSNATQIKNGIKKAADFAIGYVRASAKPVASKDDIKRVAVVSANGDEKIGEIISDIMEKIGNDGTVKVENGNGIDMTSKVVEGMVIDKSYESPYMITNPDTMEAELDNPWILLVDKKLSNVQEILPTLNAVAQTGRPLFVIAEDYGEETLAALIMNKMRGSLNSVAIKAPSYGSNRRDTLDDIAILCEGRVVTEATGTRLENAIPGTGILGEAQRVIINKTNTIIIGGCGAADAVSMRAGNIRKQIESTQDEYDKEKLVERLAKLTSGIGVITVGAATEAERKELRDRVDDAFCASKAAVRGGIVAGGGSALLSAKRALEKWISEQEFVGDENIGAKILADSMEAPIRKILANAGIDSSLIVGKLLEGENGTTTGYNVLKKAFVDMIEDGVIDPAEVVVNEIQNSASVAGLLLTTEALIVDEQEDKKN